MALARRHLAVLLRVGEVGARRSRGPRGVVRRGGECLDLRARAAGAGTPSEDRRVRAGVDAGHAPDAALGDERRDARREMAEVPRRRRAGRHDAPGEARVGGQLAVGNAAPVGGHDRPAELLDVRVHVQQRWRDGQEARVVRLLQLARALDQQVGHDRRLSAGVAGLHVGLVGEGVDQVGHRHDAHRVRLITVLDDDQAVDTELLHLPRGRDQGRRAVDGDRRAGHQVPHGAALASSPTGTRCCGRGSGRSGTAGRQEDARLIDHGQPVDVVRIHERDRVGQARVGPHEDRVDGHVFRRRGAGGDQLAIWSFTAALPPRQRGSGPRQGRRRRQ